MWSLFAAKCDRRSQFSFLGYNYDLHSLMLKMTLKHDLKITTLTAIFLNFSTSFTGSSPRTPWPDLSQFSRDATDWVLKFSITLIVVDFYLKKYNSNINKTVLSSACMLCSPRCSDNAVRSTRGALFTSRLFLVECLLCMIGLHSHTHDNTTFTVICINHLRRWNVQLPSSGIKERRWTFGRVAWTRYYNESY